MSLLQHISHLHDKDKHNNSATKTIDIKENSNQFFHLKLTYWFKVTELTQKSFNSARYDMQYCIVKDQNSMLPRKLCRVIFIDFCLLMMVYQNLPVVYFSYRDHSF